MSDYTSNNKALILTFDSNDEYLLENKIDAFLQNGILEIAVVLDSMAGLYLPSLQQRYAEVKFVVLDSDVSVDNEYAAFLGMKALFPDKRISPFYLVKADASFAAADIYLLEKNRTWDFEAVDEKGKPLGVYKFGTYKGMEFYKRCKTESNLT